MIQKPTAPFDRDAWLSAREHGIGCSELATLFGVAGDRALVDLWQRKRSAARGERQYHGKDNPASRRGRLLEDAVMAFLAEDIGAPILLQGRDFEIPIRHESRLGGSPDGLIIEGRKIIDGAEAKTATSAVARQYGEPGTDEIPEKHLWQCHGYLALTGARRWHLGVLIGGHAFEFRRYVIDRDEALCRKILERVAAWWQLHIVEGEPPDVRGAAAGDIAARRWPVHRDGLLTVDCGDALAVVEAYRGALELHESAEAAEKAATVVLEDAEGDVKSLIGAAEGIRGPWGEITWRSTRAGRRIRAKFYEQE
jgi:predicted phage-related endonuclease